MEASDKLTSNVQSFVKDTLKSVSSPIKTTPYYDSTSTPVKPIKPQKSFLMKMIKIIVIILVILIILNVIKHYLFKYQTTLFTKLRSSITELRGKLGGHKNTASPATPSTGVTITSTTTVGSTAATGTATGAATGATTGATTAGAATGTDTNIDPSQLNTPAQINGMNGNVGLKDYSNNLFDPKNNLNSNKILDYLLKNKKPEDGYTENDSDDVINSKSSKASWCFIGEDKGVRSCAQLNGNTCDSGGVFSSKEKCMNPT
jgi:cytoskeletal protein RodZ